MPSGRWTRSPSGSWTRCSRGDQMSRGARGGVRAVLARWRGRDIELKTPSEIDAMRVAGALVARTLAAVTAAARPGVSTGELDAIAEQAIRDGGGVPSFLGYHGYPASICASVNEQIVHGIPAATQVLADGDLLSVDCGAIVDGWHGDISHAVQSAAEDAGRRDGVTYGIVEEYGGHGIGTAMHMDPFLPNHGPPGHGPRLRPGMALAIEPMITAGDPATVELEDGWTVVTAS